MAALNGLLTTCVTARPSEWCAVACMSLMAISKPTVQRSTALIILDLYHLQIDTVCGRTTQPLMQVCLDAAGLSVQAGLPNIHIKDAGLCAFGVGYNKGKKNGVIFTGEGGEDVALGHGRSKQNTEIDVSTLVPIYGRSSTVQPAAIRLIPIIRY